MLFSHILVGLNNLSSIKNIKKNNFLCAYGYVREYGSNTKF